MGGDSAVEPVEPLAELPFVLALTCVLAAVSLSATEYVATSLASRLDGSEVLEGGSRRSRTLE